MARGSELSAAGHNWSNYTLLMVEAGLFEEVLATTTRTLAEEPYNIPVVENLLASAAALNSTETLLEYGPLYNRMSGGQLLSAPFMVRAWFNRGDVRSLENASAVIQNELDGLADSPMHYLVTIGRMYLVKFYLGLIKNDLEYARGIAEEAEKQGRLASAAAMYIRLDDPRAEGVIDEIAKTPEFHRMFWLYNRLFLDPDEQASHPLVLKLEAVLGYTPEWRLELCERAAALPPESKTTCDPSKYELPITSE